MNAVTIKEAQARLPELIESLSPGDELLITHRDQTVAKLVGQQQVNGVPRQPGSASGVLAVCSEDDDHLNDFEAYMP